jgi:holliday junction DNA helicase RuvA
MVYNNPMMIRMISGDVVGVDGNRLIIMTNGGVGYLVTTTNRITALPTETITLYTYLAVREGALDLYGFLDTNELDLFELLLTVSGIGPKSALQILDQADFNLLVDCINLDDATRLTKLSGISKKTAEKLVLGLRDKVTHLVSQTRRETAIDSNLYNDAFDTLMTLGYNPTSIRNVLDALSEYTTTSDLVTEAIRRLHH